MSDKTEQTSVSTAKRITKKQFQEALSIVEKYCQQQHKPPPKRKDEVGCRVKLSDWGLEMQGRNKKKRVGVILKYSQFVYPGQGTVTVKWDGIEKPDTMDISQVEALV